MPTTIHISEVEKMDNRKEYDKILELMEDHHSNYTTIMNHMEKTAPIFGDWNIWSERQPDIKRIQEKHTDFIVGCNTLNIPDNTKPKVKVELYCDSTKNTIKLFNELERQGICKSVVLKDGNIPVHLHTGMKEWEEETS